VLVDLFERVEKLFLGCEHRFGLFLDLIELLNEGGGKRTAGSGLRSRHDVLLKFLAFEVHSLAVTRVRRPQHRDGANSKWGSDRKRNAEYLTPRSRKERVQALSVPGTEKFEGEL